MRPFYALDGPTAGTALGRRGLAVKRMVPFVLCAILGFAAFAKTPTVTDVVAKQRYPWNGLVDITCKVSGIDETAGRFQFVVAAIDSGNVRDVSHVWVVRNGENSSDLGVDANGNYRLLWAAKADFGQVVYDNMTVRVTIDEYKRDKVQLWAGGPYWATTNIGADKPWEYGLYFWWGDTVGHRPSGFNFSADNSIIYTWWKSVSELQSAGWVTSDGVLVPSHDAAHVKWGGSWRMPTYQELNDLCNKCDWTWTTMNGVRGYIVRGRGNYVSSSIFLPSAGHGNGTSLYLAGSCGRYWSSVQYTRGNYYDTWYLEFNSSYHQTNNGSYDSDGRYDGQSIRPVQGFTN